MGSRTDYTGRRGFIEFGLNLCVCVCEHGEGILYITWVLGGGVVNGWGGGGLINRDDLID